jgi:hypothetical protein
LVGSIGSVGNTNCSSFIIFWTSNIQASIWLLNVAEVLSLECEDLPPTRISAPDLHIAWSSWACDIPWLVVESSLDGQWSLVEVPHLSVSGVRCLDNHISIVYQVKVSARFQLGYDMEISFDIQTEIFVQFSLSWFTLPLINIDDVPLLVDLSMFVPNNDVSVFLIDSTWYI